MLIGRLICWLQSIQFLTRRPNFAALLLGAKTPPVLASIAHKQSYTEQKQQERRRTKKNIFQSILGMACTSKK